MLIKQKPKDESEYIQAIVKLIQLHPHESGIIYCHKRERCEQLVKQLEAQSVKCAYYHADINKNTKNKVQDEWMNNQLQVIIATVAFGMGINKKDVRFVIHDTVPKSLDLYM